MRSAMLFLVFMGTSLNGAIWAPPEKPDPLQILDEAEDDANSGRYELALDKYVWFHDHALKIDPALYGVRLSFALADWSELATKYPPALAKLKSIRDAAQKSVLAGTNVRECFHDVVSINVRLDEQMATQKLFEELDRLDSKTARQVVDLARPCLVRGKAYRLLGKYISPSSDFAKMKATYLQYKSTEVSHGDQKVLDFANQTFVNDTATLVAVLVINDRKKEAETIADAARAEWADDAFHAVLAEALKGVVPDPWP